MYNYEFIYHGTDYVEYKKIHQTILDVTVYNISVVIFEGKVYAIDAEYFSCQGYTTMKLFFISIHTSVNVTVDIKIIPSGEILCHDSYFCSINI